METMKLTPIILPTGELSKAGELCDTAYGIAMSGKDGVGMKQNLYLVSDAPIKEGDWYINGEYIYKADRHYERANNDKKIILTTNPKLISDGVPAIDGNTKAVERYITENGKPDSIKFYFLSEFCKRWNDKADMVIECEMDEYPLNACRACNENGVAHCAYPEECDEIKVSLRIKLDNNRQPTLIFN